MPNYEMIAPADKNIEFDGNVFEKQILRRGRFRHPHPKLRNDKKYDFDVNDKYMDQLIKNFDDGVVETVNYLATHDESSDRWGTILGLTKKSDGVWARIEVTDEKALKNIRTKDSRGVTLARGVSAGLVDHFEGSQGNVRGPVLRHVAAATIPWIQGMADWSEPDVAASNKLFSNETVPMFFEGEPTVDEIEGALKLLADKQGISVEDLKTKLDLEDKTGDDDETASALVASLEKFLENFSNGNDDDDDDPNKGDTTDSFGKDEIEAMLDSKLAEAVKPLADIAKTMAENVDTVTKEQSNLIDSNRKTFAEGKVKELVDAGRILPAEREAYVELYMSNNDLYDKMTKDLPVRVDFDEVGNLDYQTAWQTNGYNKNLSDEEVESEIERYMKNAEPIHAGNSDLGDGGSMTIGGRGDA